MTIEPGELNHWMDGERLVVEAMTKDGRPFVFERAAIVAFTPWFRGQSETGPKKCDIWFADGRGVSICASYEDLKGIFGGNP